MDTKAEEVVESLKSKIQEELIGLFENKSYTEEEIHSTLISWLGEFTHGKDEQKLIKFILQICGI